MSDERMWQVVVRIPAAKRFAWSAVIFNAVCDAVQGVTTAEPCDFDPEIYGEPANDIIPTKETALMRKPQTKIQQLVKKAEKAIDESFDCPIADDLIAAANAYLECARVLGNYDLNSDV